MIIDTSALVAVLRREEAYDPIFDALVREDSLIPAPVLLEFDRVAVGANNVSDTRAEALVATLLGARASVLAFGAEAARLAVMATEAHGRGNGRGGLLTILDLMVFGCARAEGRPILCTGRDFAAAGAELHPAGRLW
ncbi:type II toxin-antitoxin system VapC family toxin [Rhizosaccharibacter radicis]|uniref:Ribonuclease VapC n=1 Tax=Rhizosaccharibacter radicis TaxID=2782605 RepID=A0ABT1W0Q2_9PROT|nr:type II toxin-antitoxin system VapC family toxin [Acetobacteraceae bacterium KSS12]